jgi:hypothetical protein
MPVGIKDDEAVALLAVVVALVLEEEAELDCAADPCKVRPRTAPNKARDDVKRMLTVGALLNAGR